MLSIFQATDARFRVSPGLIYLTDVTERDKGIYLASSGGHQRHNVVELKVLGENLGCTLYLDQKYIGMPFSYLFLNTSPLFFFLMCILRMCQKGHEGLLLYLEVLYP